jgi:hypothetical protein
MIDTKDLREKYEKMGFTTGDPCWENDCDNPTTIIQEGKGHRVLYGGRCLQCVEKMEKRQEHSKIADYAENQRYLKMMADKEKEGKGKNERNRY